MNEQEVARELVAMARELTAGWRVNPRYVEFTGKEPVSKVKKELLALAKELSFWEKDGAPFVQGYGDEWIPQWM